MGYRTLPSGAATAVAQDFGPNRWGAATTVPRPAGLTGWGLVAVSCGGRTVCQAVGGANVKPSAGHSVWAAGRDGAAWHLEAVPVPTSAAAVSLNAVSCPGPADCEAVGDYQTGHGQMPLAERWDGSSWALQRVPAVAKGALVYLRGVSCSSATGCEAVGYYIGPSGPSASLAEHWDGHAWHVQATANVPQGVNTFLTGVSCAGPGACKAVGYDSKGRLWAESLGSKGWALQPVPQPVNSEGGQLDSVSCPLSGHCVAVGQYATADARDAPVSEVLSGPQWSTLPMKAPGVLSDTYVRAVSCVSPTWCEAVGQWSSGKGETPLLANYRKDIWLELLD